MSTDLLNAVHATGLLAIVGTFIYAVGDVLLLAGQADLANYPNLQPHAKLLSGTERMVGLSWRRLVWGGLLGVFATPLVVAGFWQVYQGLQPAGVAGALPPVLLFASASIVGAFVHGSFIYLGEYVKALNHLSADAQPLVVGMLARHRRIMVITYAFLVASVVIASIWFSVLVARGDTRFPAWMAAVNPVLALLVWLIVKKMLPKWIAAYTEGAGFNIAYLIFFALTTATLWQAG